MRMDEGIGEGRSMVVESSQAGWVLARPLFHRLNMNVFTLNTCEVIGLGIRTGKLSHEQPGYEAKPSQKTTIHHLGNSTDKKVMLC